MKCENDPPSITINALAKIVSIVIHLSSNVSASLNCLAVRPHKVAFSLASTAEMGWLFFRYKLHLSPSMKNVHLEHWILLCFSKYTFLFKAILFKELVRNRRNII